MNRATIEKSLSSSEDEVRYRALSLIGELEDTDVARDLLVRCLGDHSWRVRKLAGEKLLNLPGREKTVVLLVDSLSDDENAGMRNAAANSLTQIGSDAVEALLARVQDPDSDVRKQVVDILGEIGDHVATAPLVERLTDSDQNVRGAAAEALGKIGGPEAETALIGMLDERDLLSTLSALDALARTGAEVPMPRLRSLLSTRLLMRPVLMLLSRLKDTEALTSILDALNDPSRGTREAALGALAKWHDAHDPEAERFEAAVHRRDPDVLAAASRVGLEADDVWARAAALDLAPLVMDASVAPELIRASHDERLRDRALRALLVFGLPAAEPITSTLEHLPSWGQAIALEALSRVGDEASIPRVVGCLESADEEVRLRAVDALGRLGHPDAVEPLADRLGEGDDFLDAAVMSALTELARSHPNPVLEACRRRLDDVDPRCVANACRVLCAVGSPAEIPLLRDVLRREDPNARAAAAEALGTLRSPETIVQLRYALADESPQVRAAAARSLGRHGGREAAEVLLVALGDEDPFVLGAAAEALGEIGDPSLGCHLLPLVGEVGAPGPAPAAYSAVLAIARLNSPELDQALYRAAAHPEGEVAKGAVTVAADLPMEAGAQVLLACARHRAWDVRLAAARAMAGRRDSSLLADIKLLASEEEDEMVADALKEAALALEEKAS